LAVGHNPARVGTASPAKSEQILDAKAARSFILRTSDLLALQRAAGNAAVVQLLEERADNEADTAGAFLHRTDSPGDRGQTGSSHVRTSEMRYIRQPISALIRRSEPPAGNSLRWRRDTARAGMREPGAVSLHDAGPDGDTPDPNAQAEQIAYEPAPLDVPEPDEGEAASVPDIVPTGTIEMVDSVSSGLTYQPVIANTGPVPATFGITRFNPPGVFGVLITKNQGSYAVEASLVHGIDWQVWGATGPTGQADIESITDPPISSANFAQVVRDLTPNPADLGGKPPRAQFWARDLSIDHEMFHANEIAAHGKDGTNLAQNFLNHSAVSSLADVWTLLNQVPQRVVNTIMAAMPLAAAETRAYSAGAPNYQRRADAIQIIGNASGYP
jgi:hypothetical protein